MSLAAQNPRLATAADLLAIPDEERFHEVIGGEIVRKAAPTGEHADAQSSVAARLKIPFQRRSGGPLPGGWWIFTEVEVELDSHEVYRPDVVGWRRERVPGRPTGTPIRILPDWVCEVLSTSNQKNDRVDKFHTYERCGVPHYWIVDPRKETLQVYRLTKDGYLMVLLAKRGQAVRAEPFDAVELQVGTFFGDEDGE